MGSEGGSVLVVGDVADPHADAVVVGLAASGCEVVALDAASLESMRWRWRDWSFSVFTQAGWATPVRAWYRRLAPPGHHAGLEVGGRDAAEAGARLALLSSLSNTGIKWVSDYWAIARAESKLVQYRAAVDLGIPVPETQVVSRPEDIDEALGQLFIVKPLGTGSFLQRGVPHAIHAKLMNGDDSRLAGLSAAPFLLQQRIEAASHLRIVTAGDRAWSALLPAEGLPIDWRESDDAHRSWRSASFPIVEELAVELSRRLQVGFTSQDWILDIDGDAWFIDANPSGQWLFLPQETADPVTRALCSWLGSGRWDGQ